MSMLLPCDMDNIYQIDADFCYNECSPAAHEEFEIKDIKNEKIGYNNAAGRKKDLFAGGVVPVVCMTEVNKLSELENTAAIRRKKPVTGKNS